jgi:hypothetical protein
MKIFKATCETDLSLVGTYPQVYFYTIKGYERPYDNVWNQRADLSRRFDMNGVMAVDAKKTQVLSCVELSPGRGLLIENSVIDLIRGYLPDSCLLHPFEVQEPINNAVYLDYSYLEVGTTTELFRFIDFGESSFYKSFFDEFHSDVDISSQSDWEAKQQEENRKGSSLAITPKTVSLRRDFLNATGIIKFLFDSRIFFTEPVAQLIKDNKVTGIRLIEERGISIHLY